MLKIKCKDCRIEIEDETKFLGCVVKQNTCDQCSIPKEIGIPYVIEMVTLTKDNPNGTQSKRRIDELSRRRMLPHSIGSSYVTGRLGDNGKVAERSVNVS